MAHVFFKESKLYLIPELPKEPMQDGIVRTATITYRDKLNEAKTNALPVANPKLIDEVRELYGWFTYTTEGELYEWPGTWEESYYCSKEVDEKCAKLIAPQQSTC